MFHALTSLIQQLPYAHNIALMVVQNPVQNRKSLWRDNTRALEAPTNIHESNKALPSKRLACASQTRSNSS